MSTPSYTLDDLLEAAAQACHCTAAAVNSRSRELQPTMARQLVYRYLVRILGLSYVQVGRLFDGRDHSTISYGVTRLEGYLEMQDPRATAAWSRFARLVEGWAEETWHWPEGLWKTAPILAWQPKPMPCGFVVQLQTHAEEGPVA